MDNDGTCSNGSAHGGDDYEGIVATGTTVREERLAEIARGVISKGLRQGEQGMNDIITILAPVGSVIGTVIAAELISARIADKTRQRDERKAKRWAHSRRVEQEIREIEYAKMFKQAA